MFSVLGTDGNLYGPVNPQTLEQWVREGRIVADTTIVDPQSGQRFRAGDMPMLSMFFQGMHQPQQAPIQNYYPGPQMPQQNPYMNANPMMGYGMASSKSKTVAVLLAFFLGPLGIHRFYIGRNGSGAVMLLLCLVGYGIGDCTGWLMIGIASVWAFSDTLSLWTGSLRDASGRPLS